MRKKKVYYYSNADDIEDGPFGVPVVEEEGEMPKCVKEMLKADKASGFKTFERKCPCGLHLVKQVVWGPSCIDGIFNCELTVYELGEGNEKDI